METINQLWVADMTYIRLAREFLYMAVLLDVFSRKVAGWSLARTMTSPLPLAALVHHSDRGSQGACDNDVNRLEEGGFVVSMSRPARPWENAYCESFMNTLKSEAINRNIEDFIERYYNC